jgi:hypothetical protein
MILGALPSQSAALYPYMLLSALRAQPAALNLQHSAVSPYCCSVLALTARSQRLPTCCSLICPHNLLFCSHYLTFILRPSVPTCALLFQPTPLVPSPLALLSQLAVLLSLSPMLVPAALFSLSTPLLCLQLLCFS